MIKNKLIVLYVILSSTSLVAQTFMLDTIKDDYPFIKWNLNKLEFAENSPTFKKLFHKLDNVYNNKAEDVHVFHIGGSHIQADIYSNRLRTYLQHMSQKAKGQRGFISPNKLAGTNNPSNYTFEFNNKWKGYRCSVLKDSVAWGMSGITAVFKGQESNIKIKSNHRGYDSQYYDFNRIRIFYDNWTDDYEVVLEKPELITEVSINKQAHFIEFKLSKKLEELDFCVRRKINSENSEFLLMGLELMNDNHGVQYTTIGVNGASFKSYNRTAFFDNQLMLYKPDLFIISVGTNDAYYPTFNAEDYKTNFESLILKIQSVNPDCAILLTVPNDSYFKRQHANPRTKIVQNIIYDLAEKHKMAVWDFYKIMGSFNSSQKWYKHELMPKDRIHFTQVGYRIKADLLLNALVNSWEKELQLTPNSILHNIINE